MTRTVWRSRLTATCLALTALAFLQDPGRLAADTKLDLTADPWGFLARALHLWDDQGFFGQLQNQAYGYLFPMGPFFGVLTSAGLPGWVVQRLWWSLLLCAAFLGTVRLARLLGVSSPGARWAAGLAFALAPRVVSTLGPISSETLVLAIAPWALLPLVLGSQGAPRWTPRRAGAVSGVAILVAGGVNAVATAGALVLPALWLMTRARGRARRGLAAWWAVGVALASLWWAVPLLTLGRYSPPFLDWIESAAVTTGRSDLATALRGTDDWVAYVSGAGGPSWPAGWSLVTQPWLVLATGLVAAMGLTGLALARRERRFLLLSLLVGLALATLGHTGPVQAVGAPWVQQLLDGALAPLRNTHKFDVVLRLPLAVGVGLAVQAIATRRGARAHGSWPVLRREATAVVLAGALLVLAAWPLAAGGITRGRSYVSVPGYWTDVAGWLSADDDAHGTALVVPGAPFGTYLWGRSQDEPLQPFATTPWAVRDAVPLSSAGNIRLLDTVEARLADGRGSAGLTETLARAGVRYLVVRNDLDTVAAQTPRSVLVHEALDSSPGITFAQGFGPPIVPFGTGSTVVDARLDAAYPAVEVYRVRSPSEPADSRAVLRDAAGAVSSPTTTSDAVLALADAGLLRGRAAVLGDRPPAALTATPVLTDSYRRSEVDFGLVHDNRTAVLAADEPYRRPRKAHDYGAGPASVAATATLEGVQSVTASSSQAWTGTVDGAVPGAGPVAALDHDLSTGWQVRDLDASRASWWQVAFTAPRDPAGTSVALLADPVTGALPGRATVVTDAGALTSDLAPTQSLQPLPTPPGSTRTLRVELSAPVPQGGVRVAGLREVLVPGLLTGSPLRMPSAAAAGGIVLTARDGGRDGCVTVPLRFPCGAALPRPGEDEEGIDRLVDLTDGGTYDVAVTARQRPVATAGRLLDPVVPAVRASASSVLVGDPRNRPQAAVDRDPSTAWIAAVGDTRPTLTLTLPEPRRITGLVLQTGADVGASRPLLVTVRAGGRSIDTAVDEQGVVTLPPVVDSTLSVQFRGATPVRSVDLQRGITTTLPVGVSEVFVRGALDLGHGVSREAPAGVACGFGPVVEVDGAAAVETSLRTTNGTLLSGRRAAATTCGGTVRLAAGTHRIRVRSTAELAVVSVVLTPHGTPPPPVRPATSATIDQWAPTQRRLEVPAADAVRTLELAENANAGWAASLDGVDLVPMVVDGWRQAFVLPAGSGGVVTLTYGPDRLYRLGLVAGAIAALALLVLAVWPTRRTPVRADPAGPSRQLAGVPLAVWVAGSAAGLLAWPWSVPAVLAAVLAVRSRARVPLVAAASAVAAVLAALVPWPASAEQAGAGAVASVLVIAAVVAACWPPSPDGRSGGDESPQS